MSELVQMINASPTIVGLLMIAAVGLIGWGLGLLDDPDRRD